MKSGSWVFAAACSAGVVFSADASAASEFALSQVKMADRIEFTLTLGTLDNVKSFGVDFLGVDPSVFDTVAVEGLGFSFEYSGGWSNSPLITAMTMPMHAVTSLTQNPDPANHSFGIEFAFTNPMILTDNVEIMKFSMTLPDASGGTVKLLSAQLAPMATFASDSGFVGPALTVSAVPEPLSIAMLLAGLGLVGYRVRSRT